MEEFKFIDSASLSEEVLRRIALIDNEIPSEFDSEWRSTDADHDERLKYYRELLESDFFKVVFRDDEVVGFHIIRQGRGGMKNIGMVSTLWVHPAQRRKGIARKLKAMGVEWAREKKLDYLQTSSHSNNLRMIEMNRRADFEPHAVTLRLKL